MSLNSLKERIDYLKKELKKTYKVLGKSIDMSEAAFGMAIKRESLSDLELKEISIILDVDWNWLKTGTGETHNKMPVTVVSSNATLLQENPNIMLVPLVHQHAYAGYLSGFGDREFLDSLPEEAFMINQQNAKGNYVCFEIRGDSMDDGTSSGYRYGDLALGREVSKTHWRDKLHINQWDFIIVHREEGVLLKRILKHNVEEGVITLHSLNYEYEDFDVSLDDVVQIFNVIQTKQNRRR